MAACASGRSIRGVSGAAMRFWRYLLCLFLSLALTGCAGHQVVRLSDVPAHAERRLLVTFVDRTINRTLSANALDSYTMHGSYGNSDWSERLARRLAERHKVQLLAQWPVTELGVSCVVYEVSETDNIDFALKELQQDSEVQSVQRMQQFEVLGNEVPQPQAYGDPYLGLQTSFNALGIALLHKTTTGRGVRIALIDTGVDAEHPDLRGHIVHAENLAPLGNEQHAADMHGTAVAGVLAAQPGNGVGIVGIAPDAQLLAFRACWPQQAGKLAARCNSFTLALALNQAIRMGSHIINLSLSGPQDTLLQLLIEKALQQGITVVAALPEQDQGGGFPASVPGVLAVGYGDSEHGAGLTAPGKDILTTLPNQAYEFMTGSSFAAPHVAGVAALLLQLHPDWRAQDIGRVLHANMHLSAEQLNPLFDSQTFIAEQR